MGPVSRGSAPRPLGRPGPFAPPPRASHPDAYPTGPTSSSFVVGHGIIVGKSVQLSSMACRADMRSSWDVLLCLVSLRSLFPLPLPPPLPLSHSSYIFPFLPHPFFLTHIRCPQDSAGRAELSVEFLDLSNRDLGNSCPAVLVSPFVFFHQGPSEPNQARPWVK
eukprot:2794365-Pyramimonas_sp.AAC.1